MLWATVATRGRHRPHPPTTGQTGENVAQSAVPSPAKHFAARRWLPASTRLYGEVHLASLAGRTGIEPLWDLTEDMYGPSVGRLLAAFDLSYGDMERLAFASLDLATWHESCVYLVQLRDPETESRLTALGEPEGEGGAWFGATLRRMPSGPWPHPFAVIEGVGLVTGPADLLTELDAPPGPLLSDPLTRLLANAPPEADLVLMADLSSARAAGWPLPEALWDCWPAGAVPYRALWEVARGAALLVDWEQGLQGQLAVVCDDAAVAAAATASLTELVAAARESVPRVREAAAGQGGDGQLALPESAVAHYGALLDELMVLLAAARWDAIEETVWLRTESATDLSVLASLFGEGLEPLVADWQAAALAVDEERVAAILAALADYGSRHGHLPKGAAGGSLVKPETRLSWIAALLPHLGRAEWHDELQFAYPWDSRENRAVTARPLPEVVNPALGPSTTDEGFPVTHYVGVAGFGADAASLPASDPRAGVFGHGRQVRPTDIADGASNTIAILGLEDRLGPWGSGGEATVRSLTAPPYVRGPDGFGSGQPHGMLAGMADGSMRFISKDVDPRVLEQLATLQGGSQLDAALVLRDPREPPEREAAEDDSEAAPEPSEDVDALAEAVEEPIEGDDLPSPELRPATVDVLERLDDPIADIEIRAATLGEAVRFLSELSTIAVTFDADALAHLGVRLDAPVRVHLEETTVGDVLSAVLNPHGLDYAVDAGHLMVGDPVALDGEPLAVRYTVSDLARDAAALEELEDMIRALVAPSSWDSEGGTGKVTVNDGAIVVEQRPTVHYEVIAFCERLRLARSQPLRSRSGAERFSLVPRREQAQSVLHRAVRGNFRIPATLDRIVEHYATQAGATVFIDWHALGARGIGPDSTFSVVADDEPLAEVLDRLLDQVDLAWRAVDASTLQVTTYEALLARPELEIYPLGHLPEADLSAVRLMARIEAALDDLKGPAEVAVRFDPSSQALFVLAPQPWHATVAAALPPRPAP